VRATGDKMTELERWVLEGARAGWPAFAFFPTKAHTEAWERVKAKGWIDTRSATFSLTASGRKALIEAQ